MPLIGGLGLGLLDQLGVGVGQSLAASQQAGIYGGYFNSAVGCASFVDAYEREQARSLKKEAAGIQEELQAEVDKWLNDTKA